MNTYKVQSFKDKNDLALKASRLIASLIESGLRAKDNYQIALSGGSTPLETYNLLGHEQLEWNKVDIFLGDERWVDMKDPASNA